MVPMMPDLRLAAALGSDTARALCELVTAPDHDRPGWCSAVPEPADSEPQIETMSDAHNPTYIDVHDESARRWDDPTDAPQALVCDINDNGIARLTDGRIGGWLKTDKLVMLEDEQ